MKKLLLGLLIGLGMVASIAYAAPLFNYSRTLIPEANTTYDLGSSTPTRLWNNIFTNNLLLNSQAGTGGCAYFDSSGYLLGGAACSGGGGGGGGGGWATSSPNIISTEWLTNTNALVGINSSTPWAVLTVKGISGTTTPTFVVASSTNAMLLRVASNGSTTLSSLGTGPVYSVSGSLYNAGITGTGLTVQQNSPTLITPILGVASSTSISVSGILWANGQANLTTASSTHLTVTGNTYIPKLSNLTTNGFVKTSGSDGTLSVDTSTYLTGNQTITLSGDVSGSGATAITTAIGADKVTEAMLKVVDTPTDEDILSYESTTGDFEWHTPAQLNIPNFSYASSAYATLWNLTAGSNITITTTTVPTIAVSSTPTFTTLSTGQGQYELYAMDQDVLTSSNVTFNKGTFTNASTTGFTASGNVYFTGLTGQSCLGTSASGLLQAGTCTGGSGNSAWTLGSGLIYNATSTDEVGIGTSTPQNTLTVVGNGNTSPFVVASSTGTTNLLVTNTGRTVVNFTATNTPTLLVIPNSSTPISGLGVAEFSSFESRNLLVISAHGNSQTNSSPGINTFQSRGTRNTPSATQIDDYLYFMGGRGYGTTAYGNSTKVAVNMLAAQNWTDSAQGTYITFETTPNASTTRAERVRIFDSGQVGINTTTAHATFSIRAIASGTLPSFLVASSSGSTLLSVGVNGSTTIANLTAAGCDVKSTTGGSLYCGTDATGASTGNAAWTILSGVIHNATSTDEVGIGTTTPQNTLTVVGNGATTPFVVASSTGASMFNIGANGTVGIGTSTPAGTLAVNGSIYQSGNYVKFGSGVPLGACTGSSCIDFWGSDNTSGGITLTIANTNSGTDAYSGINLLNNLAANTSNFAGMYLNSSGYSATTFGTAVNKSSQLIFQNTMGPVTFSSATTTTGEYMNFLVGGNDTSNEAMRITENRLIGIGTTSPIATLAVKGTSTLPTTLIFTVASSTGTNILQVTSGSQILACTTCRMTGPVGATPTIIGAGDYGTDTSNGGMFSFYANGRENVVATTTKAFFISSPTASESHKTVPAYSFDVPVTITKVRCLITSDSNTPSWTFSLPHSTSLGTASANAMSSGQACTATTTPQTITIGGDLTLAAGESIWATSSAVSNASSTTIFIDFKYDN